MRNVGNWRETEESPTHRLRKLLQKRSLLTIFCTFRKALLVNALKCSPLLPTIMSNCPKWWAVLTVCLGAYGSRSAFQSPSVCIHGRIRDSFPLLLLAMRTEG